MKYVGAKLATILLVAIISVIIIALKHVSFEEQFLNLNIPWKGAQLSSVNHGIVIDCGSSGSRIYVYKWNKDGMLFEVPLSKKVTPGLSSLAGQSQNTAEYLQPLLEFAKQNIDEVYWSKTSFFLMATAGMRLIDTSESNQILSNACLHVKSNTEFLVQSCDINFRIISGEFEGIMGWVAVNYLKDRFNPKNIVNGNTIPQRKKKRSRI